MSRKAFDYIETGFANAIAPTKAAAKLTKNNPAAAHLAATLGQDIAESTAEQQSQGDWHRHGVV
jgi:hypothetical protein